MTVKIAICQVWDKISQPMADLTWVKNKKLYCEHWGYNYHVKTEDSIKHYDTEVLKFILDTMETHPEYDWIYWSSTHVLFTNFYKKLESFVDDNNHILLAKDSNNTLTSIMIKNSTTSKKFIKDSLDQNKQIDQFEQHHDFLKIDIQKSILFNVQFSNNQVRLQYERTTDNKTWVPGDFSVQIFYKSNLQDTELTTLKKEIVEKFLCIVRNIVPEHILNKFKFDRI